MSAEKDNGLALSHHFCSKLGIFAGGELVNVAFTREARIFESGDGKALE
jgi:hypothetical protein